MSLARTDEIGKFPMLHLDVSTHLASSLASRRADLYKVRTVAVGQRHILTFVRLLQLVR
jgi:hypothetical protein